MKKYFIISVLLFGFITRITAQEQVQPGITEGFACGTEPIYTELDTTDVPWYGDNAVLYKFLEEHSEFLIERDPVEMRSGEECPEIEAALAIPVKFWIQRENEADDPISEDDIQMLIDVANDVFQANGLNFRFYTYCIESPINAEFVDVDDNDELDDLNNDGRHDIFAINVHIVRSGETSGGLSWAGVYNTSDDFIGIRRNVATNPNRARETFPHELGHYFGLDHTHQFTSNLFQTGTACCKSEPVTRGKKWHEPCIGCVWVGIPWYNKRCSRTGDYLCDTDADPRGSYNSSTCTYNGTWTDGYGDTYHPDVRNIMSYYFGCRNIFSNQQKGDNVLADFHHDKTTFHLCNGSEHR